MTPREKTNAFKKVRQRGRARQRTWAKHTAAARVDALTHAHNLYKDLVSSVPAGVYRLRITQQAPWQASEWVDKVQSHYQFDMVSERFCELLEYPDAQAILSPSMVVERIHPEDRDSFVAANVLALERLTLFEWDGRLSTPSGVKWVHFASVPRVLGIGDVLWTGMLFDISASKRADLDLAESELRHRILLEASPDIIARFDRDGRHLLASNNVRHITGRPGAEVMGLRPRDLGFSESQMDFFDKALASVFETGANYDAEFVLQCVGEERKELTVQWLLVPECDATGKVQTVLSLMRDVTERRQAEQNYRALFHEMQTAFALHQAVCDEAGKVIDFRYLDVNPAFERLLGVSAEKLTGRTLLELHPSIEARWVERLSEVLSSGAAAVYEDELAAIGRYLNVAIYRPTPGRVACTLVDITARRRAEQEQLTLREQLHHAQKMEAIGTLAGGVAHDFNNILAGLSGGLSLLELSLEELGEVDSVREDLAQLGELVQRGGDLSRQLLGFARRGKYNVQSIDLKPVLTRTAHLFGRTHRELTIRLDLRFEQCWVCMDHGQLEQVLLNLFVNAAQAMPGGGRLLIHARREQLPKPPESGWNLPSGEVVKVVISDSGVGMDEHTKARAFEPFFTTREPGQGTGLGLASVYGIVSNHGGAIKLESEPGKGSNIIIVLPTTTPPPSHASEPAELPARHAATILLVDDQETVLNTNRRLLQHAGYQVLTASSGAAAIALLQQHLDQVTVVILDLTMPEMSGTETFFRLRALAPQLKVLLSSGFSEDGQARLLLDAGCNGFIQKPFRFRDLLEQIRRLL
ncbi:MAG: PAS domain-containing protein [Myxococcota bacterium]|jgi:PAS domain S-box-containing protein|nr:PAS domain-containing protein [Myxococcota bacterium]